MEKEGSDCPKTRESALASNHPTPPHTQTGQAKAAAHLAPLDGVRACRGTRARRRGEARRVACTRGRPRMQECKTQFGHISSASPRTTSARSQRTSAPTHSSMRASTPHARYGHTHICGTCAPRVPLITQTAHAELDDLLDLGRLDAEPAVLNLRACVRTRQSDGRAGRRAGEGGRAREGARGTA